MGQYYNVIIQDKNGVNTVYNRDVNNQYTMAKLMEHSWWENPFVNTMDKKLYKNPLKIAWVGDYADEFPLFDEVWGENIEGIGVDEDQLQLNGKYLVNHDKKEYVDCDKYFKNSITDDEWCIHPLPLLTCIGNGRGGGDYHSSIGAKYVGRWCFNTISVEDEIPDNFERVELIFKE